MDWNEVENTIKIELDFLKENILISPYHQNEPINCNECLLRNIAILVVSGKIKLNNLFIKNSSIWNTKETVQAITQKNHGAEWHSNKIHEVKNYFEINNYITILEPSLYFGRADLGIPQLNIFFEIGTINLYKFYLNLLYQKNCKIYLINNKLNMLEFIV